MCSCVDSSMSGNEGWKVRDKVVSASSAARARAVTVSCKCHSGSAASQGK